MNLTDFNDFTYSKTTHLQLFASGNTEMRLYKEKLEREDWILKRYQDLLLFSFLEQMIPKKSKILEIGGGNSRILSYFKTDYECWNIDPLEGCGQGPTRIDHDGFKLVKDHMGNFNKQLPDSYFDLVFSISVLEHVPQNDPIFFQKILEDINRVLKTGGISLHCIDCALAPGNIRATQFLTYIFNHVDTLNRYIPFAELNSDTSLFFMSEKIYNQNWLRFTQMPYKTYGKPFSYQTLWQKAKKTIKTSI